MKQLAQRQKTAERPAAPEKGVSLEGPRHAQLAAISETINGGAIQRQRASNQTGLPDRLKAGTEALSGLSLDHVRVHRNSAKPAQLQAHAFAQGGDIHLGPGQEKHLPHEAWHVVQQAQGRVRPILQMAGGVAINNDLGLEYEADVMGAKALQAGGANPGPLQAVAIDRGGVVVQGNLLTDAASKLVGNTASDWLIKAGMSAVSYTSVFTGRPLNQPWFGPLTGRGFGTAAEARVDNESEPSNPSVTNATMDALALRKRPSGAPYYIRGHLINRWLHGPGDTWQNLTPLTATTNSDHSNEVEEKVKSHVPHGPVDYRVQAIYGRWPWQWPSYLANFLLAKPASYLLGDFYKHLVDLKDAEQHIPVQLDCDWWAGGQSYQKTVHQKPNPESGFWVTIGGENHNLSRESAFWELIEGSVAVALRTCLGPALIPYIGESAAKASQLLTPAKTLTLIQDQVGGLKTLLSYLSAADWSISKFVAQLPPVVLEGVAEAVQRLSGPVALPSYSRTDPIPANREARDTLRALPEDARAEFNLIKGDNRSVGERLRARKQD